MAQLQTMAGDVMCGLFSTELSPVSGYQIRGGGVGCMEKQLRLPVMARGLAHVRPENKGSSVFSPPRHSTMQVHAGDAVSCHGNKER
jgi:hypothetical protein